VRYGEGRSDTGTTRGESDPSLNWLRWFKNDMENLKEIEQPAQLVLNCVN